MTIISTNGMKIQNSVGIAGAAVKEELCFESLEKQVYFLLFAAWDVYAYFG